MAGKALRWRSKPEAKDYTAAASYLRLLFTKREVDGIIARLKRAPNIKQLPKNVERASGMQLLSPTDPEVADKLKKVAKGQPLSPVLLVRGRGADAVPLIIADGFHRVCAGYFVDQEAEITCRLVDIG